MAINDKLPGVEVVIMINGQPAKEYVDETEVLQGPDAENTVLKYIESISDTRFEIRSIILRTYAGEHSLCFKYLLDGKLGPRKECFPTGNGISLPYEFLTEGINSGVVFNGQKITLPLQFSEVEIVNDSNKEQIIDDLKTAKGLGEIVVQVYRVKVLGTLPFQDGENNTSKYKDLGGFTLGEKALKGRDITHGIAHSAIGEGITRPLRDSVHMDYVDALHTPMAVYKFRYRSKPVLKAALILDEFEDMSPEELRRRARDLARAQRESQNVNVKREIKAERGIKRERADDGDEPVDLTDDSPATKRPRVEIDLTDD